MFKNPIVYILVQCSSDSASSGAFVVITLITGLVNECKLDVTNMIGSRSDQASEQPFRKSINEI